MNCKRRQSECVYATSRKTRVRGPGKTRTGERLEEMTGRVAYLEGLIEKLQSQVKTKDTALDVESNDEGSQTGESSDDHSTHSAEQSNPRLLVHGDKNLYIGNGFWAKMNSKVSSLVRLANID